MRGYRLLLNVNAAAMAAAVLLLVFWPDVFGRLIGMQLSAGGLILADLLGASELAFATLCLFGIRAGDRQNVRIVSTACIVLHAASAAALLTAWHGGASTVVLADVAFRVVMLGLFVWLGLCSWQPNRTAESATGRRSA